MVQLISDEIPIQTSNMVDVDAENFFEQVVEKSRTVPVVVDFWAPWCDPCKTLTPILEELANEYAGEIQLAKINIDEQQELAMQFSVRSVPTVFLIKDGAVVDGFQGAQPKNNIQQFLSKHVAQQNQPPEDPIQNLVSQGRVSEAIEQLKSDDSDAALLRLANLYLRQQEFQNSKETLAKVKETHNNPEYQSISAALEFIELAENSPSEEELRDQIQQDENNWHAHYQLAAINLVRGDAVFALDTLLKIVRQDRSFDDDAGRRGLIRAFDMLGQNHELVPKYRSLLARTLN